MVKEHLNASETKSHLNRTRAEWWCFSYHPEVTVTAWDWILLKTIILFPSWPLGELFIAEKRLFNHAADYFQKRSYHYGFTLVCFLWCLHRSRKHDSVVLFLNTFRSGSAFVPSERPSLLAAKSSLCGVHFHSNKQNSHVLSRYSHTSPFTDLLLYISNNFRICGLSVICSKSVNKSAQSQETWILSHITPPD